MKMATRSELLPRAHVLSDMAEECPPPTQTAAFKAFFDEQGYVVARQGVAKELCELAKQAFLREILPARKALFMRHASSKHERHIYTEHGFMKYPIMNFQDIPGKNYPSFKRHGLDLLTQDTIRNVVRTLFGEPGQLVHTMYFDGNQTTWAHRDGHYIDSQKAGLMVGIWVAAEDIHPGSGRFFVIPRSHRMLVPGEHRDPNGEDYKAIMADFVMNGPLDCMAPILRQGDIVLWNSMTIHGSLPTTDPQFSRRSFTGHYMPQSQQLLRHLVKHTTPNTMTVNGVPITLHCDHRSPLGKVKSAMRDHCPQLYWFMQQIREGGRLVEP
jgi:phytanoyl-CoA hydroxylase